MAAAKTGGHRLTPELTAVRGRIAYWQKRIELERNPEKQDQLEMFAWAEIMRLVVASGVRVFPGHQQTFEKALWQAFEGARQWTASHRKKPAPRPARAAGGRR